jgi:hypothetical protein
MNPSSKRPRTESDAKSRQLALQLELYSSKGTTDDM